MELSRTCLIAALGAMLLSVAGLVQTASAQPEPTVPLIPIQPGLASANTSHCQAIAAGDTRMELLSKVCEFSLTYLHELPDFICQQTTTESSGGSKTVVNAQVTFRSGQESYSQIRNGKLQPTESSVNAMAFNSRGEFGSFLVDLFKPPIVAEFKFDKEAKLGGIPAAIYRFDVPAAKSFWSVRDSGGRALKPEIRGRIWVERASGRLLKLELEPLHLPADFEVTSSLTTTDYARTSLGDAGAFVLPIKSQTDVCFQRKGGTSLFLSGEVSQAQVSESQCTSNVLTFHDRHKFAATTRIVPEIATATPAQTPTASTAAQNPTPPGAQPTAPQPSATAASESTADIPAQETTDAISARTPAAPTAAQSAASSSSQSAAAQQSATPAGKSAADIPAQETTGTSIKVKVNLVEVRAVVLDARGHAVGNLKQEDFQLLDDGKPQVISKFSVEKAETKPAIHPQPSPEVAGEKPARQAAVVMPQRYIAYLFDDIHVQFNDLAQARAAAERNLQTLQPTDRVGIFTTSGRNQLDFTDNQAKLREAMNRLLPRPMSGSAGADCPYVSYYMADQIENKYDGQAMQVVIKDALNCAFNGDPSMLRRATSMAKSAAMQEASFGSRETQVSLASLKNVVLRIAELPGQRNIILVSPGFINPDQIQEQMEIADKAVHSGVIISALDARGLYTGMMDASSSRSPSINVAALALQYRRAEASADADVLAELAHATGGTFIQNSNDLEGGLRKLATPPEYTYLLGFSPQNLKYDGEFHHLQLKVKGPERLTVQARKGYYAPRQAVDATEQAKQQIHDAVFSHEEVHDIPMQMHTQFVKTGGDAAKLSVLVQVDVRRLHYRKADGRNQDSLTVVSALFDRNGNYVSGNQQVVNMDWKDETLESKLDSGVTLKSELDVKPGNYLVRLVVRDDDGELATQNGEVEIP